MAVENIRYKPDLSQHRADVVVVGGGPAGIHLTHELHRRFGSNFHTLLLEQADALGGSGPASMQQLRTFQSNRTMVNMIARAKDWYTKIGHETNSQLINPLPYLFIAADGSQIDKYAATLKKIKEWGHGIGGKILSPEELRLNFPFIDKELAGALYYPEAFQIDFQAAINYITKTARNATFALGTTMANVRIKDGRVIGVDTSQGFVATEKVVLASGPFAINMGDKIVGSNLENGGNLSGLIEVRKRQRFSALVNGLPPHTKVFVIGPGGHYVRLHTGADGTGSGDYGYAAPDDPLVIEPEISPRATEIEFPAIVYDGLGVAMSAYGDGEIAGPLAKRPISGSRMAGYYADSPDDLPIVCETVVRGLYLNIGHSHAGVMGMGAASHMADIIEKGEQTNNPFGINRNFNNKGIRL